MTKFKTADVTNVELGEYSAFNATISLGWEADGARYHIWCKNAPELPFERGTVLYKNPPHGVKHRGPGDFNTRQLDSTKPRNVDMIRRARDMALGCLLFAAAKAAYEAKLRANAEAREADRILSLKRGAAEELYAACHELIHGDGTDASLQRTIDLARAALTKADKGE
jgi:hypothetical protein